MKIKHSITAFIAILFCLGVNAQSRLHCISSIPSTSTYAYSEVDINANTLTNQLPIPSLLFSSYGSSTSDTVNRIYYYCDANVMYGFDVNADTLVMNYTLPLTGMEMFTGIMYNHCDSVIYGVRSDMNGQSSTISAFNPADSSFSTLLVFTAAAVTQGSKGIYDPINNYYVFYMENLSTVPMISAYDLTSGMMAYTTPLQLSPGSQFRGMAYDCNNNRFVGIENTSSNENFLVSVDVLSGVTTQISASGTSNIGLPMATTGACAEQSTGTYYFGTAGFYIHRFNMNTGNYIGSDTIPGNSGFSIETMSTCSCPVQTSIPESNSSNKLTVAPNPVTDQFQIISSDETTLNIEVFSPSGALVYSGRSTGTATSINVSGWSAGFYIVKVTDANGHSEFRRIIRN